MAPKSQKDLVDKSPDKGLSPTPSSFSEVDTFLHEPIRLQIMAQLYALNQADMIFLRNALDITWGNLSFHSNKLEEKGYIAIKKQFLGKKPYTLLKITPEGRVQFEAYKKAMTTFLK